MKDYDVRPIHSKETYNWLLKIHYARRIPSISYAFGLFYENKMIGVCTFGIPASPSLCMGICGIEYKDKVIELNRLVVNEHAPNVTSYFVGRCLKLLPKPSIVVSYADTKYGHLGKIYQATNFIYTGITKERTDIGFEDNTHSRHYSKDIDYKANRKFRSAKHRYIFFIGHPYWCKKVKSKLNYPICAYPKGNSSRYIIKNKIALQQSLAIDDASEHRPA